MKTIEITRGMTLPLAGPPLQEISDGAPVTRVALVGSDYVGMKPTMAVKVGDSVKTGDLLFEDKKTPGVLYTSPGCGKVLEINRGEKRVFQSIVIELDGDDAVQFESHDADKLESIAPETVQKQLITSGLWTAIRQRPFSKVPAPGSECDALFVNAMDTNPLAAAPEIIIEENADDFVFGLKVLSNIAGDQLYLCRSPRAELPGEDLPEVETVVFSGPHPAGLSGTHIHMLSPVGRGKTAWYVNYQDVIAIGRLFTTGQLDTERVIALGGPTAANPRLLRTRLGACLDELLGCNTENSELTNGPNRVVSGSVLGGRETEGPYNYLGRYHLQVTSLAEQVKRELFGWIMPGLNKFSAGRTLISKFLPPRRMPLTTTANGGHRSIFPVDQFDNVMPLDIMPVFLFKMLAIGDVEESEKFGCLELDEEDLALCTFACPGKNDYGAMLRDILTTIEKEG